MILIPKINEQGNLTLDAFSFSSKELNAVGHVLTKASIRSVNERLTRDVQGLFGLRFYIHSSRIHKLEDSLNIKFVRRRGKTEVRLAETYSNFLGGGKSSFRCSRIDNPPHDCETIFAEDQNDAIVVCALIASKNNWLGGVPSEGSC